MSKQSEAKEAQGYSKKPMSCAHCQHFSSDMVSRKPAWASSSYVITEEKNLRCTLGDFKVQKTASCAVYKAKVV